MVNDQPVPKRRHDLLGASHPSLVINGLTDEMAKSKAK
jgi:hypothetical protein